MPDALSLAALYLTAFGTILVAIVALFGDRLRPPKLRIELKDQNGELTTRNDGVRVRYYYITVHNDRGGWFSAQNVRVLITRCMRPGPHGEFQDDYMSDLQLWWDFPFRIPRSNLLVSVRKKPAWDV